MPVDLSSLDLLKESFQMAGSYNWNNVDLTQFPGMCILILAKNYGMITVCKRMMPQGKDIEKPVLYFLVTLTNDVVFWCR